MKEDDQSIEIKTVDAMTILGKYLPEIALVAIASIATVHPIIAILMATGKGIYGAWADFGQARVNELVVNLEEYKDTFLEEVITTDRFKSLFLSTLDRYIKESSETKREYLRNYLVSVAQGKHSEFDYHTKLLNILDQITGDEIRLFMLLPNIIEDSNNEMASLSAQSQTPFDRSSREISMNVYQIKMRLKDWNIKNKDLSALILFLTNYGLIFSQQNSASSLGGGVSTDIVFEGLTEIGKIFYDFIDHDSFNKEITVFSDYEANPGLNREFLNY